MPISKSKLNVLLSIVGTLVPIGFMAYHEVKRHQEKQPRQSFVQWLKAPYQSSLGAVLSTDLLLSYLAFLNFAHSEARSGRTQDPFWVYAVLATCVGVSPAFPFLLLRRRSSNNQA